MVLFYSIWSYQCMASALEQDRLTSLPSRAGVSPWVNPSNIRTSSTKPSHQRQSVSRFRGFPGGPAGRSTRPSLSSMEFSSSKGVRTGICRRSKPPAATNPASESIGGRSKDGGNEAASPRLYMTVIEFLETLSTCEMVH